MYILGSPVASFFKVVITHLLMDLQRGWIVRARAIYERKNKRGACMYEYHMYVSYQPS